MPEPVYHLNEKQMQMIISVPLSAKHVIKNPRSEQINGLVLEMCRNTVRWLDGIKPVTEGTVDEIAAAFIADDKEDTNDE